MSGDNFWLLRERSRDLGLPAELQGWLKDGEFRCSPDSRTCGWTGEKSDVPFRLLAVVFVALGGSLFHLLSRSIPHPVPVERQVEQSSK